MIRKLQKADLNDVANLWLDTNLKAHNFISAEYWNTNFEFVKEMLPQAEVYVYENDKKIQGFIGLNGEYIEGIFVAVEIQSRGIGKLLLDYAKDRKSKLLLKVYQKNTRAVRFYQREGFEIQSEGLDDDTDEKDYAMIWQQSEEQVELDSFNAEKYWNIIDEEEKSGYKFIDIAKDIAKMEKGVLYEWVAWTNSVDEAYGSPKEIVRNILIRILICGCVFCLMLGGWNVHNFLDGVLGVGLIMVVEMVIRIPLYFLEKRFEWVKIHRKASLYISYAILIVALLVIENMR